MDLLNQISLENTVTVKLDCILNQQLLAKNFDIITKCLKDLKAQQDKYNTQLSGMKDLKSMIDKLREEMKLIQSNSKDHTNNNNNNNSTNNNSNISNDKLAHDLSSLKQSLSKQIQQLKTRLTKNQGFTNDNTKDINLLNKDMIQAKEQIENLKKQLLSIGNGHLSNGSNDSKNLAKNDNLNQENINNLNKQSEEHEKLLRKMDKEMEDMRKRVKQLQIDVEDLKNRDFGVLNSNSANQSNSNNITDNTDGKSLTQIYKKIQYLTKKSQSLQSQILNNTRCIHDLTDQSEKNTQSIEQNKDSISQIHEEIQEINKILNQLQKINGDDNENLLDQIQKLKEMYDTLMKMIKDLKSTNGKNSQLEGDNLNDDGKLGGSGKNINKISNQRSFRKRSDSVDVNSRIRQLSEKVKYLEKLIQKLMGQENPQKLPSIGWRKPNQTSYNGEKSHKKELQQMKNDLQIWIKSYLDSFNKTGPSLAEIELKLQEIKNILARKADQEGLKKSHAFLQGKITQLYLFLTEPDTQDAMIVRKGFNCLSCSKKVQNLRGKLGPRMNWDNLNNHGHTPPKNGFNKYNDSTQRETN